MHRQSQESQSCCAISILRFIKKFAQQIFHTRHNVIHYSISLFDTAGPFSDVNRRDRRHKVTFFLHTVAVRQSVFKISFIKIPIGVSRCLIFFINFNNFSKYVQTNLFLSLHRSVSVLLTILPLALVHALHRNFHFSSSMDNALVKLADVRTTVGPLQFSRTVRFTV